MSLFSLPEYPGMRVTIIRGDSEPVRIVVESAARGATCPGCGQWSGRRHSQYARHLQELPVGRLTLQVELWAHRFFCDTPTCAQRIFCERISWAPAHQRRTAGCTERLLSLAWEMTASATSRAAAAQGIAVSMTTVNRLLIRNAAAPREPKPEDEPLTVVGVDDWAWKKGQRYGTLVVDLLTHRPVAVLADRAAETLADWLRQHPTIQIISRDRGGAYARAAREGAPQAQQVADRFHLLKNWGDHVAAIIGAWSPRSEPSLRDSVPSQPGEPPMLTETRTASPQKQARWAAVHRLYDQGRSIVAIAEELHCDPKTVRKDIAADRPRASEPTVPRSARSEDRLLRELWTGQRMTAQELWEAAQKQGYAKSVSTVARWLRQRRGAVNRGRRAAEMESTSRPENSTPSPKPWTGRQWAHFLGTAWIRLPRRATNAISTRLSQDPAYRQAWTLTRHFQTLVRHRCGPDTLAAWCRMAESSGIPDFVGFARTLKEDWTAVAAGVTMEWSQGPVEGLNNRTKLLKRLMYGRAGLPLLSARILHH